MNPRRIGLPVSYEPALRELLASLGFDLDDARSLAPLVLRLSDWYHAHPQGSTPWHESWAQAASLVYYFPLNYARAAAVANEGIRLGFFEGLKRASDFGSGMGSALHAFADRLDANGRKAELEASDVSSDALTLARRLSPAHRKFDSVGVGTEDALLIGSYVFTELPSWPSSWDRFGAIAIIEPSTQADARRLQAERQPLLEKNYRLWAPCTHEKPCPLLVHSEKDWCHDRIHFEPPAWFEAIEKHLPMKNRTLTFSYLLARRLPPPDRLTATARLIGDRLVEKGKERQAVCRGEEREFLSWFPQRLTRGDSIELERGSLVRLGSDGRGETLEKKSNEIRLKTPTDVCELSSDQVP